MGLVNFQETKYSQVADIENLSLPKNWRKNFSPVNLPVKCGEAIHVVEWTPEGINPTNHSRPEMTLTALGGKICPCLMVAQAWTTGDLESHLKVKDIVDCLSVDDLETFFERLNILEATHRIIENIFGSWMKIYGSESSSTKEVFAWSEQVSQLMPIGGFAAWGLGATSRAALFVSEKWYQDVSSSSVYINGRFNLGHNGEGYVLLEPSIVPNHKGILVATARFVKTIEEARALPKVNPYPYRKNSRKGNISENIEYVGYTRNYETSSQKFYSSGGKKRIVLDQKLYGYKDSATWSMRENVWQTFVVNAEKNKNEFFLAVKNLNERKNFTPTRSNVLLECAKNNIPLHDVSLNYTYASRKQVGWNIR